MAGRDQGEAASGGGDSARGRDGALQEGAALMAELVQELATMVLEVRTGLIVALAHRLRSSAGGLPPMECKVRTGSVQSTRKCTAAALPYRSASIASACGGKAGPAPWHQTGSGQAGSLVKRAMTWTWS